MNMRQRLLKRNMLKGMALLVWVMFFPEFLAAQASDRPRSERMQTFLVLRLAEALDLSTEKALQISKIIDRARQRRHELRSEGDLLVNEITAELNRTPHDEARLKELIARGDELYRKVANLYNESFLEAQEILTLEQQAKLIVFRHDMLSKLRREMHRRGQRGDRPVR